MGYDQRTKTYFGRTSWGDVRIILFKEHPVYPPKPDKSYIGEENVIGESVIRANDWCTQVAQVSHKGDLEGRWNDMKEFHSGTRE